METRANYLLVGGFVLVLLAGVMSFLVWLANAGDSTPQVRYDVYYEGSVTGLREGSPVRLNGVKVGDVVLVALDLQDPSRVRIGIEIADNIPVKEDTRASLELEGLTGGRYLLLTGSSPGSPVLKAKPGEPYPVIAANPSAFEQVLQDAPTILANINELLTRGNRLLSDQNLTNITNAFADLSVIVHTLSENSDRIDQILANVDATLASLKAASGAVEDFADVLQQDAGGLLQSASDALDNISELAARLNKAVDFTGADVRRLVNNISAAADQVSKMVAENREPLRDFTAQGLFELINFLAEARDLVANLRKITIEVERDPARFLFGDQQEGYEPSR